MSNRKHKSKKKTQTRTKVLIVLLIVVILVLLAAAAFIYYLMHRYYQKSNYVPDEEVVVLRTLPPEAEEELSEEEIDSSVAEELMEEMELTTFEAANDEEEQLQFYNLLFIGADRRPEWNWNGNSDSMILVTVNPYKKTIFLTSFMRDLYANIQGYGISKLNRAYALGAGPLLVSTIASNYGIYADNYAAVDFASLEHIINILGGVDITVKDYEVAYIDGVNAPGTYHLNGAQALAYSRIRYSGNADFERTSRQRTVLQSLLNGLRGSSVSTIMDLVNAVLPYVTHNIPQAKMTSLMMDIPTLMGYSVQEMRIPFDGQYHSVNEILIPNDINSTVAQLRAVIYARE